MYIHIDSFLFILFLFMHRYQKCCDSRRCKDFTGSEGSSARYIYIYMYMCMYIYMYLYICIYLFVCLFNNMGRVAAVDDATI